MEPVVDNKDVEEECQKVLEKTQFKLRHPHTVRYVEKKFAEKGVLRMDRHPSDGVGGIGKPPPKSGHGGKYTWEGPGDVVESELSPPPPAVDENDPNYVNEALEEKIVRGEDEEVGEYVVGEVEIAKTEEVGVARIEVDPQLKQAVE